VFKIVKPELGGNKNLTLQTMKKIGVLGGGQLGMMLLQEQKGIDAELYFLDPNPDCSVSSLTENLVIGDFNREEDVLAFGRNMDILTVEIEHVHTGALQQLAEDGVKVFPQPEVLELIQDKGLQKRFFSEHGFPTAPYVVIPHGADARKNRDFPFVLKSCRGGYDGKGVQIIRSEKDLRESFTGPCVVEDLADMKNELSIIVARNQSGEVRSFPAVEMEFDPDSNLVMALISPADIPFTVAKKAEEIAESLVKKLGIVGLLAVEWGMRRTFTDYIDDVSGFYADASEVRDNAGLQLAADIADQSFEQVGPNNSNAGTLRGNPEDRDWYIYTGIILRSLFW